MIVALELPPGSVWSEAQLSAMLDIGRTPVREALQRLESEHLVTIVTRHGAQVTEINVMQQLLLLELRRALEQLIAVGAARRATAQERTTLLEMAEELEKTVAANSDVLKFLRYHYEIKTFMATCARNPFVARAIAPCYAMSRRFYYLHYRQDPDLAVAARFHAEVVRAVALGDEAMASAASEKLMDYIVEFTRATITRF
jgi:DNA-binding GntR family transcriptional regulator